MSYFNWLNLIWSVVAWRQLCQISVTFAYIRYSDETVPFCIVWIPEINLSFSYHFKVTLDIFSETKVAILFPQFLGFKDVCSAHIWPTNYHWCTFGLLTKPHFSSRLLLSKIFLFQTFLSITSFPGWSLLGSTILNSNIQVVTFLSWCRRPFCQLLFLFFLLPGIFSKLFCLLSQFMEWLFATEPWELHVWNRKLKKKDWGRSTYLYGTF